MEPFGKHTNLIITAFALFFIMLAGFGTLAAYQNRENRALTRQLSILEDQIGTVATTLKDSDAVNAQNKARLEELANQNAARSGSQEEQLTAAVAKASPAVVSIVISKDVPKLEVRCVNPFGNDPFFKNTNICIPQYHQTGTTHQEVGAGTGFIIRSDGYIMTNRHVVSDQNADYTVLLSTGEQKTGQVVYRDDSNDVAIIKISGGGYMPLSLGDSSALKLGQTVAAIGNALGEYNNSVSVGIISGLNRTIKAQDNTGSAETLTGVIQTDAAINPGNSGGPLLNLSGEAIGINVAIEAGANSIGFAIPVDDIMSIIKTVLPPQ